MWYNSTLCAMGNKSGIYTIKIRTDVVENIEAPEKTTCLNLELKYSPATIKAAGREDSHKFWVSNSMRMAVVFSGSMMRSDKLRDERNVALVKQHGKCWSRF